RQVGADVAVGAGAVVHHHLLPQQRREVLRDQAGDDVGGAAGRKGHDQAQGLAGVGLGPRRERREQQGGGGQGLDGFSSLGVHVGLLGWSDGWDAAGQKWRSRCFTSAVSVALTGASRPQRCASRGTAPLMTSISLGRRFSWSSSTEGLAWATRAPKARTCATASATCTATPQARATRRASTAAARLTGPISGSSITWPTVMPVSAQGAL